MELERIAVSYFQHVFSTSSPLTVAEVVSHVDAVFTPNMNKELMRDFSQDDVKKALFQMHPSKAPEPDGMIALFFQKYWHIIGHDVSNAVLDFFNFVLISHEI